DALPSFLDDLPAGRWYDPLEGVEEAVLSGVDCEDHGGRNSFSERHLSIEWWPAKSRVKLAIRSYYSSSCAEKKEERSSVGDVKDVISFAMVTEELPCTADPLIRRKVNTNTGITFTL